MGPLLMTGLASFGAAVAIGLVGASTSRAGGLAADAAVRGLAIVLMAFAEGIAVLGVVVGLLAVTLGEVRASAAGPLAAGPAAAGAIVGLALIVRRAGDLDAQLSTIAVVQIVALAGLGIVVALLAIVIVEVGTTTISDGPFVVLGLAGGASALGIGATGARAIATMNGADDRTSKELARAQIYRCVPLEVVGFGASAIAILLVVLG